MLIIITGPTDKQFIRERAVARAGWDETVEDIASGEWTDISSIQHVAIGRDVTDIIAAEVAAIWHERGEKLAEWQEDFLKDHLTTRVRKLQAAE